MRHGYDSTLPPVRGGRRRLAAALAVLAIPALLVACNDDDDPVEPTPTEHEWAATLTGTEGWEHLSGEADASWTEGDLQFQSGASIAGDEEEAVRPWHVHFNTCAAGGGIVGEDGDYPRLQVGGDGTASASATVPLPLDPGADYHVNVHLSEDEMGIIIACGDLNLVGDAAF